MNCPCCLQSVPDGSLWWVGIYLTHSEARIIANLLEDGPVSRDELLSGVYVDRKSLGPTLSRLRAKIRPRGWTVDNLSNRGQLGMYYLKEVA